MLAVSSGNSYFFINFAVEKNNRPNIEKLLKE